MAFNPGRLPPDFKITKGLGGVPYTSEFALTCNFEADSADWQLASTIAGVKALPHGQLTTPSKVKIASTSANDTVLGTGARVILLGGLVNFQIVEEIMFLDGQTPVESVNTYDKVLEINILFWGSNTESETGDSVAEGNIYCGTGTWTAGVPTNPILAIDYLQNDQSSRTGIFTVPDGQYLFIKDIFATIEADNKETTDIEVMIAIKIYTRPETHWYKTYNVHFSETYKYDLNFLAPLPPKTDIQIRVRRNTALTKFGRIDIAMELQDIRI